MKNYLLLILTGLVLTTSCLEKPPVAELTEEESLASTFDFKTTQAVTVDMVFEDNQKQPFKGVKVQVWKAENGEKSDLIFTAFTNKSGQVYQDLELATAMTSVIVETNYIGIPNNIEVPVANSRIHVNYSEGELSSSTIADDKSSASPLWGKSVAAGTSAASAVTLNYLSTYNSAGVPDNLEAERDIISATLLNYINASLPESQPVPDYHPTYLANGKKTTLDVIDEADIWVTFVHEGAGWRNAIAFYTYPTDTPPQSTDDISVVNIIFPNLSYSGSGGGLISGDKVNIGRFTPGTSIGMVLLADGWDGGKVDDYEHIVYSDKTLNPEPDDALKQHNVLLWDAENELFLLGFEDVRRDDIPFRCDQDFNDAIMFVTSNPVEAISIENVSPVDKPGTLDTDGDGINDILDEYPNDANKAYDSYYPSSNTYGSFAFEDNWPDVGDYDFNDLVIDYQFKHVQNADNKVVEMEPTFVVRAIGAGYRNGFGFATDLSPGDIQSVSGASLNAGYVQTNANGTEANQQNAVFIVADNVHDLFSTSGFVNTEEGSNYYEPQTITLNIQLNGAKTLSELGNAPYNPFLIVSQNRGREVHLPGYAPTDLVDSDYFGSLDDNSNPSSGTYYRSKTDLPWAIHLPESFDYPKEKSDIRTGHLRFSDWSKSFGYSYMDWYRNNEGYRAASQLYNR